MLKKILFVCTGNTCRSAMAEGLLRAALEVTEDLTEEYLPASAGISAFDGDRATPNAAEALKSGWNIDISGHKASSLTSAKVQEAFLILTMKREHRNYILSLFPEAAEKVFTLKEYANTSKGSFDTDIADPFFGSLGIYEECAKEIKSAIDGLVEKLKKN